jgi:hypothetical protein
MDTALLPGQTVKFMRVNMHKTKNKEEEGSHTEMVRIMKENGTRAVSMARGNSKRKIIKFTKAISSTANSKVDYRFFMNSCFLINFI